MDTSFLTVRLGETDARTIEELRLATGLSKSKLVKQALQLMAAATVPSRGAGESLYDLRMAQQRRAGNAARQSGRIKQVVRERLAAKHS